MDMLLYASRSAGHLITTFYHTDKRMPYVCLCVTMIPVPQRAVSQDSCLAIIPLDILTGLLKRVGLTVEGQK